MISFEYFPPLKVSEQGSLELGRTFKNSYYTYLKSAVTHKFKVCVSLLQNNQTKFGSLNRGRE